MNKLILILSPLILLFSCQITYKKKNKRPVQILDDEAVKARANNFVVEDDFWPKKYYRETFLTVNLPKIKIEEKKLWEICKGPTLSELRTYEGAISGRVPYVQTPIVFYTDSGFQKEVYITTGMCRELALQSTHGKDSVQIDAHRNFRHKLKKMTIQLVYTDKSFATEIVFASKFEGVEFTVH